MKNKTQKNKQIVSICTLLLCFGVYRSLTPYQNPQIILSIPFNIGGGRQFKDTSKMFTMVGEGGSTKIFIFDPLLPDFSTVAYNSKPRITLPYNNLRNGETNKDDNDILFLVRFEFDVYRISTDTILATSTQSGHTFNSVEHLKETNLVFTGGHAGNMYRFDYTDRPLSAQVSSTAIGSTVRTISLLETDSTETAWTSDNFKIFFVDRTTDMSVKTRDWNHAQLQTLGIFFSL